MQYRCIHQLGGQRTFAVVLATGDEILSSLQDFVEKENIHAASFTAIGALKARACGISTGRKRNIKRFPSGNRLRLLQ